LWGYLASVKHLRSGVAGALLTGFGTVICGRRCLFLSTRPALLLCSSLKRGVIRTFAVEGRQTVDEGRTAHLAASSVARLYEACRASISGPEPSSSFVEQQLLNNDNGSSARWSRKSCSESSWSSVHILKLPCPTEKCWSRRRAARGSGEGGRMHRRFLGPRQRQGVFRSRRLTSFRCFRSPHLTGRMDGHIDVVGANARQVELQLPAALLDLWRTSRSCSGSATSSGTVLRSHDMQCFRPGAASQI